MTTRSAMWGRLCVAMAAGAAAALGSPQAEAELREAVRRDPASFEANSALARRLVARRRIAAAIPYLETAHRLRPDDETTRHDLGLAYIESLRFDKARLHLRASVERRDSAGLRNLLGVAEDKAGNFREAAAEFEKAARMEPSEKHLFDLGDHLVRYRGQDEAVKVFEFAVREHPRSPRLRVGLGVAQYAVGRYDEAVESLCSAIDLDPGDSRALSFLGKMHDVSEKLAGEVTRRLEGLVARHPKNATAHYYYALSLWKRRQAGDSGATAEGHLKKTIELDPKHADAHYQLGILREDARDPAAAIGFYATAVRLNPSHEAAHYRLAQLYSRSGRKELAARHMAAYQRSRKKDTADQPR